MLIRVNQSLTTLRIKVRNDTLGNDSTHLLRIRANLSKANILLNGLVDKLLNQPQENLSPGRPGYKAIKEITNYKDLLDLASQVKDPDSLDNITAFITDDLALKYDPAFAASSDNSIDLVPVHIRVFKANSNLELSGYICKVKPEWSLNADQVEDFNPTMHAVKKITPGRKVFWIEKNGATVETRKERVRIGDGSELVIDFTAQ